MESPLYMGLVRALKATPMAYAELPSALKHRVIDGQENPAVNIDSEKMYESPSFMASPDTSFVRPKVVDLAPALAPNAAGLSVLSPMRPAFWPCRVILGPIHAMDDPESGAPRPKKARFVLQAPWSGRARK